MVGAMSLSAENSPSATPRDASNNRTRVAPGPVIRDDQPRRQSNTSRVAPAAADKVAQLVRKTVFRQESEPKVNNAGTTKTWQFGVNGKEFHYFLSHKKEHSKHGCVPGHVALNLHDSLQLLGFHGWCDVDNLHDISKDGVRAGIAACLLHDQSALLGSAPARPLCLLRARLEALGGSTLPERGQPSARRLKRAASKVAHSTAFDRVGVAA